MIPLVLAKGNSECTHEGATVKSFTVIPYEGYNAVAYAYVARCEDCGLYVQTFSAGKMTEILAYNNIKVSEGTFK